MPFQLSGIGIQRDDRTAVKIVTRPRISIPIRPGVAGSPINKIEVWVIACRCPNGSATVHPGFAAPCLVARLAWLWNDVEAPSLVSGLRIECRDVAADAILAATGADNDLVFHHERRDRERVIGG